MYFVISMLVALFMGTAVIIVRMKAQNYPTNVKKIILPPFFMSTGALMYVVPYFRLTPMEILEAVVVGMFFSIFLIYTSNFVVKDNLIYMKRSKLFPLILISLLIIRSVMKFYLSSTIHPGELAGMFFLLAFSMIVPWRIAMYIKYKKLERTLIKD
ncbi:cytochrome C biogenesis protein CcdC [Macrococcus epidermidis]|uniref:Cytochrome C biogenesis protein CcdC n=1 Tax=Macrococcus epidermidis TaxID=1902580 RepID=A0A327ZW92_9STAP|nr:cytochrome c biogenesis protein CcdC [Macrococcus epidermidis]MCG7419999.1 cytochrome c biogenesis protein CcdC [Macrococcus epidermidis]RAK46623.1 cytochrome C biogenesis protein CcdC [Macrococcus epidermidis]UTH15001.1 cytochrome c biogenesis protein CcdC [Macrococcus epidermidis]